MSLLQYFLNGQISYSCFVLSIFELFLSSFTFYSLKDEKLRYPVNVDGHFLLKPVDELFRDRALLTVPFMTGVNDDEGGWLLTNVSTNAKLSLKFV